MNWISHALVCVRIARRTAIRIRGTPFKILNNYIICFVLEYKKYQKYYSITMFLDMVLW